MRHAFVFAAGMAAALAYVAPVSAQSSATLGKIKETGVISVGHRDASIPFSYLDDNQQPVGYSIELCDRIIDAVKSTLELPDLKVEYVPVTSATRIPLLANGTVDIECGSTTNTAERQQQVSFSFTTYVATTNILAKKTSNISAFDDLKGKTVVSTAGTTPLRLLNELNTEKGLNLNILTAKDHAEGFLMVETDRAVGFVMDDILVAGLVANSRDPQAYSISPEFLSVEPYAIMLPRGDDEFKELVNKAIGEIYASGEIAGIYGKWFESPIPPRGVTLALPMSAALKRAVETPTDTADPEAYK